MLGNTSGWQVPRCGCRFTPNSRENVRPFASFGRRRSLFLSIVLPSARERWMVRGEETSYRRKFIRLLHLPSELGIAEFGMLNYSCALLYYYYLIQETR